MLINNRNDITILTLDLGDTLVVNCKPCDGEEVAIGLLISTIALPNDRMAMCVELPRTRSYRRNEFSYVLLDDPNRATGLSFVLQDGIRLDLSMLLDDVANAKN